jgi:hypothetical protein
MLSQKFAQKQSSEIQAGGLDMVHYGIGRIFQRKNETNFRMSLFPLHPKMGHTKYYWSDKNQVKYTADVVDVKIGTLTSLTGVTGEIQDLGFQRNYGNPSDNWGGYFNLKVVLPPQGKITILWHDERNLFYAAELNIFVELTNQPEFIRHFVETNQEFVRDWASRLSRGEFSKESSPEESSED